MCYLKAFTVWCLLAICVFRRSSPSEVCTLFPAKGLEKLCGYNATVRYDYISHFDSAVRAVGTVSRLMGSCSPYANLIICSVYIPRCVANIEGPYLPCRRVCDEFNDKCGDKIQKHGMDWIIAMCRLLPVKDDPQTSLGYLGRCFEPPNFKTNFTVESTPKPPKCYPLVVPVCQNIGYEYTVLNTEKQKAYIGYANRKLSTRPKDNSTINCPLDRKRFFCTENFPACIDNTIAFYCRQKCENFFHRNCSSPFFYDKDMCMEFPMGSSPVDICKQTNWPRAQNWPAVKKQSASNVPLSCYECSPEGMGPGGTGSPLISCSAPKQRKCGEAGPGMPYDRCMTVKVTVKNPNTGALLEQESRNCSLSSMCSGNKLCNLMNNKGAFVKCGVQCCKGNLCNGGQPQTTVGPPPTVGQAQTTVGPSPTGPKPENPKAKARKGKSPALKIAGGVFAVFIIALAVLIAYIIYRKKKQMTIPYDKQILYNDETVDF